MVRTINPQSEASQAPPRERILAAARDLFYRHGIRAVGVEAIAEAAATNKMTLYRHFGSKDELIAAYVTELDIRYLMQVRAGTVRTECEWLGDRADSPIRRV